MLNPKSVRENQADIEQKLKNRVVDLAMFHDYVSLDQQWRDALQAVEKLKEERNASAPKGKPSAEQLESLKRLSETIKQKQEELGLLEEKVKALACMISNIHLDDVPVGKDDADNVVVREEGELPSFSFEPLTHDEIGQRCGLFDAQQGAVLAGSRFVVYRNQGAVLERALINFMLDMHTTQHGYEEVSPPVIVNSNALKGTGQLPKFSDDLFKLEDSDYWLSPTAEVQLTNLYQDTVLSADKLPQKITAYTPCFRREAGSYGKDMKGLIRLHQFNKVELVQVVHPDQSSEALKDLLSHAEGVLKALGLAYRVVDLCTGDLGFSSAKTFDLEVWFPSQNAYREISSCSNFLDFQSRRAMIRYKQTQAQSAEYVHTINGSGLAVGRTVAAILEQYQQDDGSVSVPECLIQYTGFKSLCPITKNL